MDSDSPVVSLTTDLIAASKGAPVTTRDGLLLTSFHAVLPAVSTARRLQWAIQGLSEGRDLRGASIAVLIHYAHDLPVQTGETAVRDALEQATPGQILLTESIGKAFDDLPGFPSKPLEKSGLRELLWRAPENQSTRSFDEQVLTQLLEQQGLQDDLPEEPERIAAPIADEAVDSDSGERARSSGFLSMAKSPLGIGIAAAVLLAGGWFIFHSTQSKQKPESGESTPLATNTTAPTNNPSPGTVTGQMSVDNTRTSSTGAATGSASPALTAAEKRKQERLEKEQEKKAKVEQAKTVVTPPPPPKTVEDKDKEVKVAHGCDEDAAYYANLFAKGRANYSQGHYSDALRQFETVARCQPSNGAAKEWAVKAQHEKDSE